MNTLLSFASASASIKNAAPAAFLNWALAQPDTNGEFSVHGLSIKGVHGTLAVLLSLEQREFTQPSCVNSGVNWVSWKAPLSQARTFGQAVGFGLKTPEDQLVILLKHKRVLKAFEFYKTRRPIYTNKLDYELKWRGEKCIMSTKTLPMFDWDIPDEGHLVDECITFQTREGVLRHIEDIGRKVPLSLIIEHTPGGVRGWWGDTISMEKWAELSAILKCDRLYHKLTLREHKWNCRVSPKLIRKDRDYVARFFTLIGAKPTPHIIEAYKVYRDLVSLYS